MIIINNTKERKNNNQPSLEKFQLKAKCNPQYTNNKYVYVFVYTQVFSDLQIIYK